MALRNIQPNHVTALLDAGRTEKLRSMIRTLEQSDISQLLNQLSDKYKISFYLLLPSSIAADVLLDLSQHSRKIILKNLKDKYIVSLIESAESDDSADIIGEVTENKAKRILRNLTSRKKKHVEHLIKYDEDSAGGLMQSELILVKMGTAVSDALNIVRKRLKNVVVSYIYVVDDDKILHGVISVRDLISEHPRKLVDKIMKKEVISVPYDIDKEEVAHIFRDNSLVALPVVDHNKRLLGRVTVDDVIDVINEEATEDMYRMVGVHPDEDVFDPFFESMKHRLPWLIINLGTAILAAFTVSLFTNTIEKVVILAAFMPIIAGMGGNAGTQTMTIIVRSFALNELKSSNYRKVLFKESLLGITHGFITGFLMGILGALWTGNPMIGVVLLLSMMINLFVSGFVGTCVPIILKGLGVDPAIASSIFVTTFTDVVGFMSFLGIATLLMNFLA